MFFLLPVLALLAAPACAPAQCVLAAPPLETTAIVGEFNREGLVGAATALVEATERGGGTVHLVIDSPGGRVDFMFAMIDLARDAQKAGVKVECTVDGMAASAAVIFLEAGCSTRSMTRGSQLMYHQAARGGGGGKSGDFRRAAEELEDLDQRVATLIAWRMGMTAKQYIAWISDRNRWVDAAEALERGFVDSVVH